MTTNIDLNDIFGISMNNDEKQQNNSTQPTQPKVVNIIDNSKFFDFDQFPSSASMQQNQKHAEVPNPYQLINIIVENKRQIQPDFEELMNPAQSIIIRNETIGDFDIEKSFRAPNYSDIKGWNISEIPLSKQKSQTFYEESYNPKTQFSNYNQFHQQYSQIKNQVFSNPQSQYSKNGYQQQSIGFNDYTSNSSPYIQKKFKESQQVQPNEDMFGHLY